MRFTVITHVKHINYEGKYYAYEPYVKEMNIWFPHVDEVEIVAPLENKEISPIQSCYTIDTIFFNEIDSFDVLTIKNKIKSLFLIPGILIKIFNSCRRADHIHLRCPGNIGLLGCFVQILFPKKEKTVKYAGNWDPKSKQPLSYRTQKWIISNTFLTRNCKVLVYGNWKNQTKNILPFFTASYRNDQIKKVPKKKLKDTIRFIFVGSLSEGKNPLKAVKIVENLFNKGLNVKIDLYGDGILMTTIKNYIKEKDISSYVTIHGNSDKETVKEAYIKSHFLLFLSKSEGWPKVVAESMFWGCLPICNSISCIPEILDYGNRGILLKNDETDVERIILNHINNNTIYHNKVDLAMKWSRIYTLDKFNNSIKKLLVR